MADRLVGHDLEAALTLILALKILKVSLVLHPKI